MSQFMVMIHEDDAASATRDPAETKALLAGLAVYEQKLRGPSAYVDGGRLRPSSEAKRVHRRDGEPRVTAGPFFGAVEIRGPWTI